MLVCPIWPYNRCLAGVGVGVGTFRGLSGGIQIQVGTGGGGGIHTAERSPPCPVPSPAPHLTPRKPCLPKVKLDVTGSSACQPVLCSVP